MLQRRTLLLAAIAAIVSPAAYAFERERTNRNKPARKAERRKQALKSVTQSYGPALLDIYRPDGAENAPVFIHVHGGGWRNGTRKYVQSKPEWFVKNGWVFVSIDYRMLPDAPVAIQADDVKAAYHWVRNNIVNFGGDTSRVVVSGHSAGCHLVALTGCRGDLAGAKALVLCDVDVYDIQAQSDRGALRQLHKDAFNDPAQWKALSPITFANVPHMPMLIAYSRVRGHKRSAIEFAAALKKGGTHAELFDGSRYSHFAINRSFGEESGGFTAATMDFLRRFVA